MKRFIFGSDEPALDRAARGSRLRYTVLIGITFAVMLVPTVVGYAVLFWR